MRNTDALMSEFGAALQFFDGFGENWYALEECLACLDEWLPAEAYILVVERAEELLQDSDSAEMISLLRVLHESGKSWASPIEDGDRFDRPAVPFHVLFNVSTAMPSNEIRIIGAARDAGIPLRH